jgi:threonine dehydratase
MRAALEAGGPVTLDDTRSVADGLLPVRAGELTWAHLDALAEGVVTVSEEAIRCGTAFLLHRHRLVAEYSGGATSGALIEGALELAGRRVAVVVSGGNLDPSLLPELAARFDA